MALTTLALAQVSLTSANADALAAFYENGLGFTQAARETVDATPYGMPGSQALVITMSLGEQLIELVQFDQSGAPYPATHTSYDPWFHHIAVVVTDINAALARLNAQATSPTIISKGGPVTLPASSGGITAVKLRDPELHPFELIQFPAGNTPAQWSGVAPQNGGFCLGIDHSALVVSNTEASAAFYAGLGLQVSGGSLNQGTAQDALDAATGTVVQVTALSPAQSTPHVELLCYSAPAAAAPITIAPNDIAATRLVMRSNDSQPAGDGPLVDPDGHRLMLQTLRGWSQPNSMA
jgi:catechol 2,3-dioxygenase-like lactoylglutathione lyase family enzyme